MKKRLSFLVAGICLLLLPACSESELLDRDGNGTEVNLKPGEKAVTFTLEAPGSGAVPATRAAGDANDEVTLPGESDIDKLDIYCFVQKLNVALSSQLERIYRYSKNGTGNDFVLMAAAGGYKLGIGVPEDNGLRRFLIIANDLAMRQPMSTTTYTEALGWTMGTVMSGIGSPFPMSAKVLKPVLMNDGSYIYQEEPFSAEDLEKGVKVQLQRRVARFDIDNPISDFFEVTRINVKSYEDYGMFNETTSDIGINSYGKDICTNADFIAGAVYCYPGGATAEGSNGADVEISGNYLGAPATITASSDGKLQPNSRYIVRIHDGNKLNATLEVAPWNEGGKIDASPTGPYAKEVNVSVPEVFGREGSRYYAYIDTAKHIIRVAGDWQEKFTSGEMETMSVTDVEENPRVSHPFLELKGANGETAPVGVILSEALKGRVRIHNNAVTGITQLEMIPTEEEIEAPLLASESGFVSSPASITFVTQPGGDGSELKYEEWTLIEDFFIYSYLESPRCIVMSEYMPEVSLRSTQTTQTTKLADGTTVTLSPYINDMGLLIEPVMEEMERSKTNFYIEKGREWLGSIDLNEWGNNTIFSSASSYLVYPSQDNNTGEAREGVVVVRSVVNDDSSGNAKTTGTIDERRYRIIQPPITPQTQTGLAAYVEFVLEPEHTAKELRMEGNTIYMNYGTYSDNAGGIELLKGSMKAANQSGILAPFSLHSEGRKPVRVLIPNDCNWLTVSALRSGMLYINPSDNFIRTFLVEPNKTDISRRVSFTIQTCVNGKVKDTVYQLVQEPTKKGTGGGQESQ